MFDARSDNSKSGGGIVFGLVTVAIVSALFVGVLYFPSLTGPGQAEVPGLSDTSADRSLVEAFDDAPTLAFIQKLNAASPSAANELEREVRRAKARGADKVELGILVLEAGTKAVADNLTRLGRADVDYFNRILDHTSTSLQALSRSGAPYCKGSDLVEFANLPDQQLYAAVFDRVGHGAGLYEFSIELNGIFLDAIRDARAAPVSYARLNASDAQALQTLAFSVMTNPDLMLLLNTEGKSRAEMDEVLEAVNFCDLGVTLIGQVDSLPDETKGRLWSELWLQVERDGIERMFYRYAY